MGASEIILYKLFKQILQKVSWYTIVVWCIGICVTIVVSISIVIIIIIVSIVIIVVVVVAIVIRLLASKSLPALRSRFRTWLSIH